MSVTSIYLDTNETKVQHCKVLHFNDGLSRVSKKQAREEGEEVDARVLVFCLRMRRIWDEEISRRLCACLERSVRRREQWSDKRSAALWRAYSEW